MTTNLLQPGDTIGIIAPCHAGDRARYLPFLQGLRALGYQVKEGENLYKATYGYAASEQERADDFHQMLRDDAVKMILFGGGSVGSEMLPLIDFDLVRAHPKLIVSYSNGTTLLCAIYANTNLPVYYGQTPGIYANISPYDHQHFVAHFVEGNPAHFQKAGGWTPLNGGVCEGTLLGGYSSCFAMSLGNPYSPYDPNRMYILFLENHQKFTSPGAIAAELCHIEQHGMMLRIAGLLFGHYAEDTPAELLEVLRRFGRKHGIPVAKCDDFGHGACHAILPIGRRARLDADQGTLHYLP